MSRGSALVAVLGLLVGSSGTPAFAQECSPLTILRTSESLGADWAQALQDLVAAGSTPGQPWSCSGARVSLLMVSPEKGAVLRIETTDDRMVERLVPTPADVVPTGEALLAAPPPEQPTPKPEERAPREPVTATTAPEADAPPRPIPIPNPDPRLIVDASIATRFSGPDPVQWGAVELDATVPFDAWSVTLWGRGAMPFWVERDDHLEELKMSEYTAGLAVGRRLFADPFELRAALLTAVALVSMDGERSVRDDDGEIEHEEVEGARADFRLGARVSGVWTFARPWRIVASLDGELVPVPFVDERARSIDPTEPRLLPERPRFTTGLTFGFGRELP